MEHAAAELGAIFDAAGAKGYLHAVDLASGREVGTEPDAPVVAASVFKVPVLLELVRRFAAGDPVPTDRVRVGSRDRVMGPTGLSTFSDDVELSWRDLASLI